MPVTVANAEVRKTSAAVDGMAVDWALIEALMGGTNAMRQAGKKYLPQWAAERWKTVVGSANGSQTDLCQVII